MASTHIPTASTHESQSGHTPGPWTYLAGPHGDPDFEDCDFMIAESRDRGEVVGTVTGPIRGLWTTEANARLIAAAPDLLAALKALRHFASGLEERGKAARELFSAVDRAIARAEKG